MEADDSIVRQRLGIRRPFTFKFGCSDDVSILQHPCVRYPSLTDNYAEYLNARPCKPDRYPHIGASENPNSKAIHNITRNCLCACGNRLYEASKAEVREIEDPQKPQSWNLCADSISIKTQPKSLRFNSKGTFGISATSSSVAFFSHSSEFESVKFMQFAATDCAPSDFITGEYVFIDQTSKISLYNQEKEVMSHSVYHGFDLSSVIFASHPRIIAASQTDSITLFDLRLPPNKYPIMDLTAKSASALLAIDRNQIAASQSDRLLIFDIRFPKQPPLFFQFDFASPATSLGLFPIGQMTCIYAQCCQSSDVVLFPLNETQFSNPLRPFVAESKPYLSNEANSLTGVAAIGNMFFLQFESGLTVGIECGEQYKPGRHFFSEFTRAEDQGERSIISKKPELSEIPKSNGLSDIEVNWGNAIGAFQEAPPYSLLRPCQEAGPADGEVPQGYLVDLDDALGFAGEDMDQALPLFWQNHMSVARTTLF